MYQNRTIFSMMEDKSEGIVLKATPYKEKSRILSIFTLQSGVISVIVKHLSKKKPALTNLTSPLCRGEFVYRKGRSSLYSLVDGSILDLHLSLRSSYRHLQVAGQMLRTISDTQFPKKSVPALYQLLLAYLKKLSTFTQPETLGASFQLKFLRHEGMLSILDVCNRCQKSPASRLFHGESFCPSCAPHRSLPFSKEDWDILTILFHSRCFDTLSSLSLQPPLQKKIEVTCKKLL